MLIPTVSMFCNKRQQYLDEQKQIKQSSLNREIQEDLAFIRSTAEYPLISHERKE